VNELGQNKTKVNVDDDDANVSVSVSVTQGKQQQHTLSDAPIMCVHLLRNMYM